MVARALRTAAAALLSAVLAACGGAAPDAGAPVTSTVTTTTTPSSTDTSSSTASSSTAAPSPTGATPVFPPQVQQPVHGGQYSAVYLAVARDGEDPSELDAAAASAEQVGYTPNRGLCEDGAREALGLDPAIAYDAVSIFFDTPELAQQFVDAYEPGVVGTARVVALCLD